MSNHPYQEASDYENPYEYAEESRDPEGHWTLGGPEEEIELSEYDVHRIACEREAKLWDILANRAQAESERFHFMEKNPIMAALYERHAREAEAKARECREGNLVTVPGN